MSERILYSQNDMTTPISFKITRNLKADYRLLQLSDLRDAWSSIAKNLQIGANGCVEPELATTKASGKGGIQRTIKDTKYSLNVLVYILFYRFYDEDLHVSHRCGKARCINPEHLVLESRNENESRKGCPREDKAWASCPHSPKCIGFGRLCD